MKKSGNRPVTGTPPLCIDPIGLGEISPYRVRLCLHPLDRPESRMPTASALAADGNGHRSPEALIGEVDRFWTEAEVAVAPEDPRPGSWAGAPSAVFADGEWWLAYRLRRPVGAGRGSGNVVARSADGVRFQPVMGIGKDRFRAESLERPPLVRTPAGRWRLYVSCATPGTKHWRVDLLEADTVAALADAEPE